MKILQNIGLFLVSLLFLQCITSNETASKSAINEGVLRIMTYNIHHANPPSRADVIDVSAIAEVIRKENPDLVALQEVDVNTKRSGKTLHEARELAEQLGMNFYFAKALDYQEGFFGNAVLSRYPLLDSLQVLLPSLPDVKAENRVLAAIKIQISDQKLWFGSTHLDYQSDSNNLFQSRTLLDAIDSINDPFILGGDFNVDEYSETIALFDQYFKRTCPGECPPTIPVKNPNRAIDFLMYRSADFFSTLHHKVIDEQYASDHLPVVADLTLVEKVF